jgi:hypothetical protein
MLMTRFVAYPYQLAVLDGIRLSSDEFANLFPSPNDIDPLSDLVPHGKETDHNSDTLTTNKE